MDKFGERFDLGNVEENFLINFTNMFLSCNYDVYTGLYFFLYDIMFSIL